MKPEVKNIVTGLILTILNAIVIFLGVWLCSGGGRLIYRSIVK